MSNERVAESRGIPEVQYYDGRVGGEVNKIFSNIVNVEPYKCPRYQQGMLEDLSVNKKEKGNKDFSFLKGRKGFKNITVDSNFNGYEFVDSVSLGINNDEYFLALNFKRTKAKIGKLIGSEIVDISMLNYNITSDDYFDFELGLSEKITKTYFVSGTTRNIYKDSSVTIVSNGIKRYKEGVGYYITDEDVDNGTKEYDTLGILPGDYLYLIDTGEVGTVTLVEKGKILIDGVWRMQIGGQDDADGLHEFIILSERNDTFIFQTKKGPVQFHNIDNSNVQLFQGGGMYGGYLKISGMCVYQDNIYFIDKKSGRLYYCGSGIQQMVVGSDRFTYIGYKYRWLNEFQDYIIMSGTGGIAAAYGVYTDIAQNESIYNIRWQPLVDHLGVWNEHAITSYPEGVQLIGTDGLLYALGITPTGSASGRLIPSLQPQSYYIVDDIKRLNKDARIYLRIEGMDVKIFINNSRIPNDNNTKNTKILIYDYHYKFWYKRMLSGIHINNNTDSGFWYGVGVYENTGTKDMGSNYKQIISAVFGEGYSLTGKYITMVKFLVGQHSKYTKGNTEIKIRFDNGGRSRSVKFDNLGSSEYVKNVMNRHNGGNIETLADGTIITDGNGVPGGLVTTLNTEFSAYEAYENSMETILGYEYEEDLAKRGKLKLEVTAYVDVAYIDIVSKNGDMLDFGGYLLGFSQTDTDSERLTDTLGLEN